MTPRGGFPHGDGDNTPQGKLARGCTWLLGWIVLAIVGVGLAQLAEHWWRGTL